MDRKRKASEGNIYHVISRGTGRQLIYETDDDRRVFLHLLRQTIEEAEIELYAWCLMGNHFHLLIHGEMERIATCMRRLCSSYARWFNGRAGRVGHLFQERFKSEPIDTDAYLLAVIRYIHDNPAKARLDRTSEYRWSSYREYVGKPTLCATEFVLDIFGGKEAFLRFHEESGSSCACLDFDVPRNKTRPMDDDMAIGIMHRVLGDVAPTDLKTLPKKARNKRLSALKQSGLSVRQIERLTGIGRNIIARVQK